MKPKPFKYYVHYYTILLALFKYWKAKREYKLRRKRYGYD